MILVVALCFVALVGSAPSVPEDRECIYDDRGLCMGYCPEGTYSYTPGCGPITEEPTCDNLQPVASDYDVCDLSDCYCKPPTVRDTASKKCVPLEECPDKENIIVHD
ncbi:jg17249 [Pararge aegeria aegeria]|uniref:Jg17249 protein n=1 Tax=Pararge aegeria aegeria TaxID=348720 RepID=A0A8S4RH89_9NEOP|nr:jg17249 [Pararge aegeria aegeria]